ncbi:BRO family protein [Profundibacter sp.]
MPDIIPFDFETNAVRILMRDGAPWFVAADVCRVLEHTNPTVALSRLDDDEKCVINPKQSLGSNGARGGAQTMNVVDESGLFALILTSRKPAAKRFRKWVTAEVLPAIRRGGSYGLETPEMAELVAKREYLQSLPEAHRQKSARAVQALEVMEEAIESGANVSQAVEVAADELGISLSTMWHYRRAVYMVPRGDWEAALAPKWSGPRNMCVDCDPNVVRCFIELSMSGARVSDSYRRLTELAEENGWGPVPSQRTMYRFLSRLMPKKKEVA